MPSSFHNSSWTEPAISTRNPPHHGVSALLNSRPLARPSLQGSLVANLERCLSRKTNAEARENGMNEALPLSEELFPAPLAQSVFSMLSEMVRRAAAEGIGHTRIPIVD